MPSHAGHLGSGKKDYHIIYLYAVTAMSATVLFAFVLQTDCICCVGNDKCTLSNSSLIAIIYY